MRTCHFLRVYSEVLLAATFTLVSPAAARAEGDRTPPASTQPGDAAEWTDSQWVTNLRLAEPVERKRLLLQLLARRERRTAILVPLLNAESAMNQQAVQNSVLELGEPAVIPLLEAMIATPPVDGLRHNGPADLLSRMGSAAHNQLRRALNGADLSMSLAAQAAIRLQFAMNHNVAAGEILCDAALHHTNPIVRRECVEDLSFVDVPGCMLPAIPCAREALTKLLEDQDRRVRFASIRAVARVDPNRARKFVPQLSAGITDPDEYASSDCFEALECLGSQAEGAKDALVKVLNDENLELSSRAAFTLAKIGGNGRQPLLDTLANRNPDRVVIAINAIASMSAQGQRAVPAIIGLLKNGNAGLDVQCAAAAALPELSSGSQVVTPLIEAAENPNAKLRSAAVEALGHLKPRTPTVLRAIKKALTDPDRSVRDAADEALRPPGFGEPEPQISGPPAPPA